MERSKRAALNGEVQSLLKNYKAGLAKKAVPALVKTAAFRDELEKLSFMAAAAQGIGKAVMRGAGGAAKMMGQGKNFGQAVGRAQGAMGPGAAGRNLLQQRVGQGAAVAGAAGIAGAGYAMGS